MPVHVKVDLTRENGQVMTFEADFGNLRKATDAVRAFARDVWNQVERKRLRDESKMTAEQRELIELARLKAKHDGAT